MHRGPARAEGAMSTVPFEWHCGTCPRVLSAPDLETLREQVLDHIRHVRRRGVTQPKCKHCGGPIDETSVELHTTYWDDSMKPPRGEPVCVVTRGMSKLIESRDSQ
jgi:hypothetical protein